MADDKNNDAKVLSLLPLHQVPDGGVRRPRGRPKRVERQPSKTDLDYHRQVLLERARVMEDDAIVAAVADRRDGPEVLRLIVKALAEDAALLAHARAEASKRGADPGQLTSRRATLLDRIADLTAEEQRLRAQVLDLRSEPARQLFELFVEAIKEVAVEVLDAKSFDLFFNRLESRLDGWEEEAEARLR